MADQNLTVEQRLKALYELQQTLSGIDKIKAVRDTLPNEVKDIDAQIEGLHTRISKFKQEIDDQKQATSQAKNDIAQSNEMIAKYTEQINTIRNNREYDALQKEIEMENTAIELANKHITDAKHAIESRQKEIEETEVKLGDLEHALLEKKRELEEITSENKVEEEYLRQKAKETENNFDDPRLLRAFKSIRNNAKNGLGIVYIQREACGGCFNRIPPQRQLEIKMRKKVIVCEYCGRILIDPELAGVEKTEEAPKKAK